MSEPRHPVLASLGRAVRARRAERELTLAALSGRAGVSERFLAQLESGQGNISVVRLADVARALGTTAAALLDGVEPEPTPPGVVALLGLRGAGKSTVGPLLARRLKVPFVELDHVVEQEAGMTLGEVFELHGESFYRRLERETLRRFLSETERAVLATGGSLVSDAETFELLRKNATTVWLKARPEDHMARVRAQGDVRPMRGRDNAMAELRSLLRTRTPLYAQADHVIDTNILGVKGAVDALCTSLDA